MNQTRGNGFSTAIRTLTVFRVPGRDVVNFHSSLPFFPLVGTLLGSFVFGVGYLLVTLGGLHVGISAFVCVLLSTVLTGGLHLDGLADASDGLLCLVSKERRLEIMKDSTIGTYGALSLVLVLLLKWITISFLFETGFGRFVVVAFVLSRTAQVELASTMKYARASGGTARNFVCGNAIGVRLGTWLIALVCCGWMAVGTVLLVFLLLGLAVVLRHFFQKKVGGVTGDLLGATSELSEVAVLSIAALAVNAGAVHSQWRVILFPVWRVL